MSRLDTLIAELCPDGVEYKALSEIGSFFGGLSGKTKNDFTDGNAKFITYMNVFSNIAVNNNITATVKINKGEKQNNVRRGDIIFTGSSETLDESGMSSVVVVDSQESIFLNSFCFGFRLFAPILLLPEFSKHLFRSSKIRKQIIKTASGVTRFNISKKKMERIIIPVPPLPVQQEIARILDKFTALEAELEAELEARKVQYEYYRDILLMPDSAKNYIISDICKKVVSGGTPSTSNSSFYGGTIPWLRTQEIDFVDIHDTIIKITDEAVKNSSANWIPKNCVIVAMYGATAAKVAINKIPLTTNQACCNLLIDETKANFRYVFYWLSSQYLKIKALGKGSQSNINSQVIKDYPIPLPSLAEQERIVAILDRFDALVTDIKRGLPAEIAARRKQYEHYRDRLLTFKEAA